MWWPTPDELKRAGVITGIARPDDFALSGFGTAATDEDIEGELQKIPLFGTIAVAVASLVYAVTGLNLTAPR